MLYESIDIDIDKDTNIDMYISIDIGIDIDIACRKKKEPSPVFARQCVQCFRSLCARFEKRGMYSGGDAGQILNLSFG